jgi:hypothetical protein
LTKIIDYCSPFDSHGNFLEIDDWLIKMINDTESSFLIVFKRLCDSFDNDELNISSHLNCLCKFLKSLYSKRGNERFKVNKIFPSELISYCMRHLNKLAILLEIFSSVLSTTQINDIKLQIQIVKSLVQVNILKI